MHLRTTLTSLVLAAVLLAGAPGAAPAALVDFLGFGHEDGGLDPSLAGDTLDITAVASGIDPLFGVDLSAAEVTLHFYGLVSTGASVDPQTGWTVIHYDGGTVDILSDASLNAEWGVFPPNATSPATFDDGELLFRGEFTTFTVTLSPNGSGVLEGMADGVAGSQLAGICSDCVYGFAGVFDRSTGAQIPDGYDLQLDGSLDINSAVPVATPSSWGDVKALYGNSR